MKINTVINCKRSFDECSHEIIATIFNKRIMFQAKQLSELDFKKGLVLLLVDGMTDKKFRQLSDFDKVRHFNRIRWAIDERITRRPFDIIKVKNRRYLFPKDNFSDTTAIEFAMANIYYLAFARSKSQNFEALYNLLSIFIRPINWEFSLPWTKKENVRIAYDTNTAEKDACLLRDNMPFGYVVAFLHWFEHNNNAFIERNEELFDDSGEALFRNGEGWIAMLEDIAESQVHGNFDEVCQKPVHTIFMYLRHTKVKIDKQLEEQEKANSLE